ncbi:hypothetical protein BCR34DRAFT_561547 [Clohesyomyces aquaticus]|uniref:Uncharacterized protein n=1 Tax=Clohesyomyces aquaticus TaxID=1231657 RepID=A0A1Y1ZTY3_9PLEO|nr:hypothetical protein BCR34DRAFT_561547 [Clohesyomyces aquaticus]
MGNLCGKQSKDDNFAGPGRTLGAAPPPSTNAKASVPARVANPEGGASAKPKVTGPGRTVGGGSQIGEDARAAAAAAAERRNNKTAEGDLAKKLEAQKKKTQNQTLQEAAQENRLHREVDAKKPVQDYR